ncbi:monothiol glutaredoxin [Nematocida sp. AWRm77]|nr:monothiol glutaredoxin [Nematocida sp. AWRm77]
MDTRRVFKELDKKIVVLFSTEHPFLEEEELSEYPSLDLTENKTLESVLVEHYSIKSLPVVLCYGQPVNPEDVKEVRAIKQAREQELFHAAVESIKKEKRVLFIKGTPEEPYCRFTRALLELLQEEGLSRNDYVSYNVLDNEAIREGMKEYSVWPTFPQVYVSGKFVGGLDVLKQLKEKNSLKSTLGIEQ